LIVLVLTLERVRRVKTSAVLPREVHLPIAPKPRRDEDETVARRKKLFRVSPGDRGDIERLAVRPRDTCFDLEYRSSSIDAETYRRRRARIGDVRFHDEPQDTECAAWRRMLELVERATEDERSVFWPASELDPEDLVQIIELPRSIGDLKFVKHLRLYGSHLVRIPPEIGAMSSLEYLDVYTSHRLHWFPHEITRCAKLRDSRVSTRSLYGNINYRSPFPPLNDVDDLPGEMAGRCSVSSRPFEKGDVHLAWISLWIGTDVLPLLVRACTRECLHRLPRPAEGYVPHPHVGGLCLQQPPSYFSLDGSR
jgi:hypothetical protein